MLIIMCGMVLMTVQLSCDLGEPWRYGPGQ